MSDYVWRIFYCLSKLFRKENLSKQIRAQPQSRYSTPLRAPSRMNTSSFRNPDLQPQRPKAFSTPIPRRVPMSCPILRCPSQTSLRRFASEDDISSRPESYMKDHSSKKSQNKIRKPFNSNFVVELSNSNDQQNDDAMPEFPQIPIHKSSKLAFDYYSSAGHRLDSAVNSSAECYETCERIFPIKRQCSSHRNNQFSHDGCPKCNPVSSRIPVWNVSKYDVRPSVDFPKLPRRHRGRYTLNTKALPLNEINDLQANEDNADNICFRPSDISNWIAYRNDTSVRFERVFKMLSKKKHTIGNLIDSMSHVHWMQLSGVGADRDASMFKQFAGGKVVLTFGEYKFLIDKICTIHDLDYWDVLRKMATFQDDDVHHEALLTSQ